MVPCFIFYTGMRAQGHFCGYTFSLIYNSSIYMYLQIGLVAGSGYTMCLDMVPIIMIFKRSLDCIIYFSLFSFIFISLLLKYNLRLLPFHVTF